MSKARLYTLTDPEDESNRADVEVSVFDGQLCVDCSPDFISGDDEAEPRVWVRRQGDGWVVFVHEGSGYEAAIVTFGPDGRAESVWTNGVTITPNREKEGA